jgi:uncharacterized protein (TIGR02246 family)
LVPLALAFAPPLGLAQQPGDHADDKAAIGKNAEAFVEAFHKSDAKAVAAFWAADGDYTDQAGRNLKGRDAIEKAFAALFANAKGLKVRIESDTLRFLTPDVAVEDGTSETVGPAGLPPSRARYTIVHVKKGGLWQLGSVREAPFAAPSNAEHLAGLAWAVGDWTGDAGAGEVEQWSVAWADNQNFLVATSKLTARNVPLAGATQWIGWDPVAKRVRSWTFDATGGYGEGTWTDDGKQWVLKSASVLQDGRKATATYVITPVDGDTISFQARDRTLDGKALPEVKEIRLRRTK